MLIFIIIWTPETWVFDSNLELSTHNVNTDSDNILSDGGVVYWQSNALNGLCSANDVMTQDLFTY